MSKKIAVLSASWHVSIVGSAEDAFVEAMVDAGYDRESIKVIKVPGALEIPLAGKIALQNGFDIAVGVGFVTDGKIYHREYVAHTVVQSILDVSIATDKPFLSVVLAPQNYTEGDEDDEAWFVDHMKIKGKEAAEACMQMLNVIPEIKV